MCEYLNGNKNNFIVKKKVALHINGKIHDRLYLHPVMCLLSCPMSAAGHPSVAAL